jgi:hypothetical protein
VNVVVAEVTAEKETETKPQENDIASTESGGKEW